MGMLGEYQKSVAFILYINKDGHKKLAGTAFFVCIDNDPDLNELGALAVYCVTARHVIAEIQRDSINSDALLRINKKTGGYGEFTIPNHKWLYHPDENQSVDAAITPVGSLPVNDYDVKFITLSMAITPEIIKSHDIEVGDEIFIVGLFSNHIGKERNLPIVRTGNIALMPGEKVYSNAFGDMEAYLIEARSLGGLSGSPVFARKSPIMQKGSIILSGGGRLDDKPIFWLGIIHGHWHLPANRQLDYVSDSTSTPEKINTGIAIVVPTYKIIEIINQPILRAKIDEEIKVLREKKS